jgi:hypothetical protein
MTREAGSLQRIFARAGTQTIAAKRSDTSNRRIWGMRAGCIISRPDDKSSGNKCVSMFMRLILRPILKYDAEYYFCFDNTFSARAFSGRFLADVAPSDMLAMMTGTCRRRAWGMRLYHDTLPSARAR